MKISEELAKIDVYKRQALLYQQCGIEVYSHL